jgi:hypothetical protein
LTASPSQKKEGASQTTNGNVNFLKLDEKKNHDSIEPFNSSYDGDIFIAEHRWEKFHWFDFFC